MNNVLKLFFDKLVELNNQLRYDVKPIKILLQSRDERVILG